MSKVRTVSGVPTYGAQAPTRIIVHTADQDGDPASLISVWKNQGKGYGSTIAIGKDGQVVRFTPDAQTSYSTGGANTGTLSIELMGNQNFTAAQWAARPAELAAAARVIAGWSTAYKIPIKLSTDKGISTHAMQSALHPESENHQDPGVGFPMHELLINAHTIASTAGRSASKWLGTKAYTPLGEVAAQTTPTWNHPGVIRGVREAFYDPLGSWDISSGTGGFGGAIGKHDTHVHVSVDDAESAILLINVAQRMGMRVGENPYTDPNMDGAHVSDSYHYRFFPGRYNGKKLGEGMDVTGTPTQMATFYKYVTQKGQGDRLPETPAITYTDGAKPTFTAPPGVDQSDRVSAPFMEMVLKGLGAPVTESNMRFLAGWAQLENTAALNNPLATTRPLEGKSTTLSGNEPGVKNYPDPEDGVKMTVATLNDYPAIARMLKGGEASRMLHGNQAVYRELNLWGGKGHLSGTSTYTDSVEANVKSVQDPYANARGVTGGTYTNMDTPETNPTTSTVPPTDRTDQYPEVPMAAFADSDVPGWEPNLIAQGSLYGPHLDDPAHSNMLSDIWQQVASGSSVSPETNRYATMYGGIG